MNIFITDKSPVLSAKNLDDKRVIKMIAESVQMLSTALHCHGVDASLLPVKPTHANHPSNLWVRATRQNYKWLLRHAVALMHEKRRRYPGNKPHIYEAHIKFFRAMSKHIPAFCLTPFANVAANKSLDIDYTHLPCVFTAYRLYLADRWETDKKAPTWYKSPR
ncbi:DNA binding protein [Cronobacter phage CR9]|uniref:Uncharacterized protein n=1 Tax=Cronobacter phage CR9 TaxID=1162290 RepID=M1F3L8_9CAUD|nr:DNA binding protein [Cronobacter phage CR9]AFH21030.1 hypothetical protein CR9_146 [Cronobacter phage CR9]